jgi:diguanylate cyclase (GGDEF)-like protein
LATKSERDLHNHTEPMPTPTLHAHPIALVAGIASMLVGLAVLVGWVFEVTTLKSVLPDFAAMSAGAAASFGLLGSALLLAIVGKPGRPLAIIGQLAALAATVIATGSLIDFATGIDLGINNLVFANHRSASLETVESNQMVLATAVALFMLAIATLLLPSRGVLARRLIQVFVIATLLISTVALVGYCYGFEALYKTAPYSAMAVHTAVASLLLGVGLLYARADFEIMAPIRSPNMGGVLARQLLPAVMGVPLLLGWVRLVNGSELGEHGFEIGVTIHTITMIIVFAYMIWCTARSMNELDSQREMAMKAEHEMRILAGIDPLTGVLNRRSLCDRMEREWSHSVRHGQPLAAIMLDIDWFKRINDTHGHAAGDAILRNVAAVLVEQCRPSDLVCRYGGDEFCLLIRDTTEAGAATLAERLCAKFAERLMHVADQAVPITCSFGVTERSEDMANASHLIEHADRALLAAKQAGRDRVVRAESLALCMST